MTYDDLYFEYAELLNIFMQKPNHSQLHNPFPYFSRPGQTIHKAKTATLDEVFSLTQTKHLQST